MQAVYANCIINIAADDAVNSTIELRRTKRLRGGVRVSSLTDVPGVYVHPAPQGMDSTGVSHTPGKSGVKHVLDSCAWAFQERMLSPRLLHFSAYELAWECDKHVMCECHVLPRASNQKRRGFRRNIINNRLFGEGSVEFAEASSSWYDLIDVYSRLSLTFESDKLLAISRLASRAANTLGKTYLAGLWKEDLPHCLLWQTEGVSRRLKADYHHPTWSWASIRSDTAGTRDLATNITGVNYQFEIEDVRYNYGLQDFYKPPNLAIIKIKKWFAKIIFNIGYYIISKT